MKNKKTTQWIIAVVLVLISFYAGMKYAQGKASAVQGGAFGPGGRGQFFVGAGGAGRNGGGRVGGGFTAGEILSKDSSSVTLKLADGGSKIIFVSSSTPVMKFASGSFSDLIIGQQISVTGSTNSDGSVTAQSIQLRPTMASSTAR